MHIPFRAVTLALSLAVAATAMPAAAFADSFGAIAYSFNSGAFGWSANQGSRRSAERTAMSICGQRDCKVLWFKDACGAVAAGPDGWGSGWAANSRRAQRKAIDSCSQYSYDCRVVRWQCTGYAR